MVLLFSLLFLLLPLPFNLLSFRLHTYYFKGYPSFYIFVQLYPFISASFFFFSLPALLYI